MNSRFAKDIIARELAALNIDPSSDAYAIAREAALAAAATLAVKEVKAHLVNTLADLDESLFAGK